MVTHNPLYGSGQAGLPHPALTSGDNAYAAQGIRMTSAGGRQPAVDQAPHPVPKHSGFLAAPQERAMPEPTYLEPKRVQRRAVGRHSVITNVSTHDRPQPLAHFRDGVMHASFEFGLHLAQLRLQPFANRLSQNREPSITPLLPTDVGKAEEVERLRFPFSALLPVFGRERSELQQQHRNSERSFPPVALVDVRPTHRLGPIRSSLQPMGEILEIILESLAVVPPCLSVHTGRGFLLQTEVGHAQRFQVVDVVEKRREPRFLILTCCLTYPLQRTGRVRPARCPGRVLLLRVPFGQTASLRPLRRRLPSLVRGLRRYYWSVRLPVFVHHRRASLDFPMRPQTSAVCGERGISRFPCEVLPYVHGGCDRAGARGTSRYRRLGWRLPLLLTAS